MIFVLDTSWELERKVLWSDVFGKIGLNGIKQIA